MKRQAMMDKEDKKMKDQNNQMDNTDQEEMEDEEKACGTKKSQDITEDDLQKSIERLESYVEDSDPVSRKEALLNKALKEDLSPDELQELYKSMGGESSNSESNEEVDSIIDGFENNEVIQKALDVSDYLGEQHQELMKALGGIEAGMTSNYTRQHEYNIILAKSIATLGRIVGDLKKSFDGFENTPVRKPTSVQPLNKAFAGNESDKGDRLSKSEVMNDLMEMAQEGHTKIAGYDLSRAVAQLEASNQIAPAIIQALQTRKKATA